MIHEVINQYAADAPFLWVLRDQASRAPDRTISHLAGTDLRVIRHLDGLRIAGEAGRATAESELRRFPEGGEAFVAAVLALGAEDTRGFQDLALSHEENSDVQRGLLSAVGWIGAGHLKDTVHTLANAAVPAIRALAVGAYSVYRADPKSHLAVFLEDDAVEVRARALRLAGEIGRRDLLGPLKDACGDTDPNCAFWAAWSVVRLGERAEAIERLAQFSGATPAGWRAFTTVLATLPPDAARDWLRVRWRNEPRFLVAGAGLTGMPDYLPWLLQIAEEPGLSRLAGEAVSLITGVDLYMADLSVVGPQPDGGELATEEVDKPTPDPGTPDAWFAEWERDLPVPDTTRLSAQLAARGPALAIGRRHLKGRPVDAGWLAELNRNASQRVRRFAAILAGLAAHDLPLINCATRPTASAPERR